MTIQKYDNFFNHPMQEQVAQGNFFNLIQGQNPIQGQVVQGNFFNPIQVMKKHPVITAVAVAAVVAISSAVFYWYNHYEYVCDIKLLDRNSESVRRFIGNAESKYFCQMKCIETLGRSYLKVVIGVEKISSDVFETCSFLMGLYKDLDVEFKTN